MMNQPRIHFWDQKSLLSNLFSANEEAPKFCKFMSKNFKKIISLKFDTEWHPRIVLNVVLHKKCFIAHPWFTHSNADERTKTEN